MEIERRLRIGADAEVVVEHTYRERAASRFTGPTPCARALPCCAEATVRTSGGAAEASTGAARADGRAARPGHLQLVPPSRSADSRRRGRFAFGLTVDLIHLQVPSENRGAMIF